MKIKNDIKTIVTHKGCPDGIASALFVSAVYPNADVIFATYNTDDHDNLIANTNMLFVDMTPPKTRVQEFVDAGAYVLDHHIHAKDIVLAFGEKGLFDNERCGALLAYSEIYLNSKADNKAYAKDVYDFARLADLADRWIKTSEDFEKARKQAGVLSFLGWEGKEKIPYLTSYEWGLAKLLWDRNQKRLAESRKKVVVRTSNGISCVIASTSHESVSDLADVALSDTGAHMFAGFFYTIDNGLVSLNVSLRSRNDFDVGAIAKKHGGGGHKNAAGFAVKGSDKDPMTVIVEKVFQ